MKPYVDRIFESFKTTMPLLTAELTKKKWLDGKSGWRSPLCEIGQRAKRVCDIEDIRAARDDWAVFAYGNVLWVRQYLQGVPLLDSSARQADHDDKIFRQFMKDLATLAEL